MFSSAMGGGGSVKKSAVDDSHLSDTSDPIGILSSRSAAGTSSAPYGAQGPMGQGSQGLGRPGASSGPGVGPNAGYGATSNQPGMATPAYQGGSAHQGSGDYGRPQDKAFPGSQEDPRGAAYPQSQDHQQSQEAYGQQFDRSKAGQQGFGTSQSQRGAGDMSTAYGGAGRPSDPRAQMGSPHGFQEGRPSQSGGPDYPHAGGAYPTAQGRPDYPDTAARSYGAPAQMAQNGRGMASAPVVYSPHDGDLEAGHPAVYDSSEAYGQSGRPYGGDAYGGDQGDVHALSVVQDQQRGLDHQIATYGQRQDRLASGQGGGPKSGKRARKASKGGGKPCGTLCAVTLALLIFLLLAGLAVLGVFLYINYGPDS